MTLAANYDGQLHYALWCPEWKLETIKKKKKRTLDKIKAVSIKYGFLVRVETWNRKRTVDKSNGSFN